MFNLWIARLFEQLDFNYYYCVVMVHLLYIATEPFNVHIVWLCFQFFTSITLFHPILDFHCHEFQWLTWTPLKNAKTGKLKVHCHKKSNDQSWPNYHLCFPAILGRRLGTWLIHSPYAAAREKLLPSSMVWRLPFVFRGSSILFQMPHEVAPTNIALFTLVVVFTNKSTCLIGWFMNVYEL